MTTAPTLPRTAEDHRRESAAFRDQILDAVEVIAADLGAEADATEADGKLTDRALDLLREVGTAKMMLSAENGGFGMVPGDAFPVLERISAIDGSIGWVATIVASAGPMINYFAPDVVRELMVDGLPFFCASSAPTGRAVRVEGGYVFSGSYSYSSGGLHADWVFCPGVIVDPDADPGAHPAMGTFVVPRSAVVHQGNWDTLGLRGTGSVDFSVTDHFVPDAHVVNMFGPPQTDAPEAQGGLFLTIHLMHLGWATGITRRLLDEVAAHANRPATRPGASPLAADQLFRTEYAQWEMAARGARALVAECWADIDRSLAEGRRLTRRQITLLYGASIQAHNVARDIATWAFVKGGGTTLRRGGLQRVVRDTLAGCQHILVSNSHLTDIGHDLLGAPEEMMWMGPVFAAPPSA